MIKEFAEKLVQNQEWAIVVALSLLVALLRAPSLEQPFDNDSGAIAYHARLIVRGEPLYGTHHPGHHMPAAYYTYALAFLLFGDSVWAVKFLLILWTIVAAYLLYRMGTLLSGKATGALAAVCYSILTSHVGMAGTTAEIELFANLPRIAAILVLSRLVVQRTVAWKFASVGVLSAAAFLFKAVYLSPLMMAGLVLLAESWRTRTRVGAYRTLIMRGLWVGVGFAAGLLPVVVYFGLLGLLPRFFLVFTMGQRYVSFRNLASAGNEYLLLYPLLGLVANNVALLVFSLAALLVMVVGRLRRRHSKQDERLSTVFYVAVWYVLSFAEASINRADYSHYCLLMVPPLALLAAWFLLKMYRDVNDEVRAVNRSAAALLLTVLLAIALFISIRQNFGYYRHYTRYRLGVETYQDFLLSGSGWCWGQSLVRVQELADYVKEHTSPADTIYYWSEDVQVYYLADRRCSIDIIWPLYAEATGSYQRVFSPQTRCIIVDKVNSIPRPAWLYAELAEKYALEAVIGGQEVYHRAD